MLFADETMARWRRLIADGGRRIGRQDLELLLELARAQKPAGFDAHYSGAWRRYQGDQKDIVRAALESRFPFTWESMPILPINYLRFFAAQNVGFYRKPPARAVVDDNWNVDSERTERLAELLRGANLDGWAPEMERRADALKQVFVMPRWHRQPGETVGGRLMLDVYSPSDVWTVIHHSDPGNLQMATGAILRIAQKGVDHVEWFQVWVRQAEEDDAGNVVGFGPWRVHHLNERGEYLVAPNDDSTLYVDNAGQPLPLPLCQLRWHPTTGTIWADFDRDLVPYADALNVARSSKQGALDMQGFTPLFYAGNQHEKREIVMGPSVVNKIGIGESAFTVGLDPKTTERDSSRMQDLMELAVSQRNSPNAYAATASGAPESGISRQLKERDHDALLDEVSHAVRLFEETQLLPACVRVHDAFSGLPPIGPARFHVTPAPRAQFEDPEAKVRRLQMQVDAGVMTRAQMAVELGLFETREQAAKAGVSDSYERGGVSSIGVGIPSFGGGQ
jgi:hypothetical protein